MIVSQAYRLAHYVSISVWFVLLAVALKDQQLLFVLAESSLKGEKKIEYCFFFPLVFIFVVTNSSF